MTREEKTELIERERDAWQCDADDHKKRGCMAHYEHEQAMADALTDALAALETCTVEPSKSARSEPVSPATQLDENGLMPCGCGGMTNQEKEALLKRIYSLPTEWADGGGSYGKGGPVGSEDAAMLWPEDVIAAISQFAEDNNAPAKQPDTMISLEWVKTTDRLPTKEDAGIDDLIAFCYRDEWDCFNRLEKWDEISPQKHTYWHRMLKAPEVEE